MTIMPKKKKPAPKKPVAKRPAALRSKPTAKPTAKARPVKKTVRAARPAAAVAPDRVAAFREAILRHLKSTFARDPVTATRNDWWSATCMAVRDQILARYIDTQTEHAAKNGQTPETRLVHSPYQPYKFHMGLGRLGHINPDDFSL